MGHQTLQFFSQVSLVKNVLKSSHTHPFVAICFLGIILHGGVDDQVLQHPGDGGSRVAVPGNADHYLFHVLHDCEYSSCPGGGRR